VDADGRLVAALPAFASDVVEPIALYRAMVLTRLFDTKAIALQRTGRLGTYASSLGQEAVAVGVAAAMQPSDVLLPSFREHGAQLWRGVTLEELFLYWGGDERGNDFAGPKEDFPNCVPVGSHAPHAVGVALAFRLRKQARAAVCVFGDGATSKGDVAEALNMAGVWKAPAVFVVNNNQWAISVPVSKQTAAPTLAQKALAAGMPGAQVDGNDVIAVRARSVTIRSRVRATRRADIGRGADLPPLDTRPRMMPAVIATTPMSASIGPMSRSCACAPICPRWGLGTRSAKKPSFLPVARTSSAPPRRIWNSHRFPRRRSSNTPTPRPLPNSRDR
jgi:pyruvate dehydrogenase E1 component alpha subunit